MRAPFYAARLSDLEGSDVIDVTCSRCAHQRLFRPMQILRRIKPGARLPQLCLETYVSNLKDHLTCTHCPPGKRMHRDFLVRVYQPPRPAAALAAQ
jgi:hypothetical protein